MIMDGFVGSVDGVRILRKRLEGPAEKPLELGERMVAELLDMGAHEILAAIREANDVDDLLQT